jgi:hypothetical protein
MGNGYLIMTLCSLIARVSEQENINFLLANFPGSWLPVLPAGLIYDDRDNRMRLR